MVTFSYSYKKFEQYAKKKKTRKKTPNFSFAVPQLETFGTDSVTLLLVTSESILLNSNSTFLKSV